MGAGSSIFGLDIRSELALPGMRRDGTEPDDPQLTVVLAAPEAATEEFSGPTDHRGRLTVGNGESITITAGVDGDLLLLYESAASFHISPAAERVLCSPVDPGDRGWQRVLLDTVLSTAAMVAGREALHAAAVVLADGRLVAVTAPPGGGKSTLCAELIGRGGSLFADDVVVLDAAARARCGPALMNLPAHADLGRLGARRLASFGDEEWVSLPDDGPLVPRAARLDLFAILDRRAGAGDPMIAPERSGTALIAAALDSGPWPERRLARFDLLADVAASAAVARLTAGDDVAPSALAETLEGWE